MRKFIFNGMDVVVVVLLSSVSILSTQAGIQMGGIYETDVYWHPPLELVAYKSYRNARLLEYIIPEQTAEAWWDFHALNLHAHCEVRDVYVYLQHGGYPVISPYNETFPEDFYLHRTMMNKLTLKTDNTSFPFSLFNPLPGSWFATFVLPDVNTKIGQKGLTGKSCVYALSASVASTVRTDVMEISMSYPSQLTIKVTESDKIYRYYIPEEVHTYDLSVTDCTAGNDTSSTLPCPFIVSVNSQALADSATSPYVMDCSNDKNCSIEVVSPATNRWSYLQVMWSPNNVSQQEDVSFKLSFEMHGCHSFVGLTHSITHSQPIRAKNSPHGGTVVYHYSQGTTKVMPSKQCHILPSLGRLSMVKRDFTTAFVFSSPYLLPMPLNLKVVPDTLTLITQFEIVKVMDSGGTLRLLLFMDSDSLDQTQHGIISLCAQKDYLPTGVGNRSQSLNCSQGLELSVNTTVSDSMYISRYIPYPEYGTWFITLRSQCINKTAHDKGEVLYEACKAGHSPTAEFSATVGQCRQGQCSSHGTCREYISGVYVFSSCDCEGGWRGYGCSDGSHADSLSAELTAVLLLTLSNLFFIPAIIMALYRRFFIEALIYGFTMFFSTFYHACDTSSIYQFCMMHYNVLSYCDFYGSILSFWVTLLSMSRLPDQLRSILHMAGALGLALGVEYDRHGLWVFLTPALCGIVVMAISWVRMCCTRRSLYPTWKRYLFFLLPGVICAGIGLVIFAFLETDKNYKFTHSVWHAVIAISIVFLLPPRRKPKGTTLDIPTQETVNLVDTEIHEDSLDFLL